MEVDLRNLSVAFRKFRAALDDLPPAAESMSKIVELDVAIERAFRMKKPLSADLTKSIASSFSLIIAQISALSVHLVERIDHAQKLMLASTVLEEDDSEFAQRSSELRTLLNRFHNLPTLATELRLVRQEHGTKGR